MLQVALVHIVPDEKRVSTGYAFGLLNKVHKGVVGVRLLEAIRGVMGELGDHLLSLEGVASAGSADGELRGNRNAFKAFVQRARKRMPQAASSLLV